MNYYAKFYAELNERQRLAVDTIDGPLLILAGPGTGKTQLLSVRAGAIVNSGKARPENILILTYTNAAAKAMKERLARIIGPAGYDVEVGTFHSFANSIIQESEEAANYVGDKVKLDDVERMQAFEYILDTSKNIEDIRPFRAPYTYLKEVIAKIGDLKKDGISPLDLEKYLETGSDRFHNMEEKHQKRLRALSIVYRRYEELKEGKDAEIFDERGRYDFDDMIAFATEALMKEKVLRAEYQARYSYVMVDEYQDTNGAQLGLLFALLDYEHPNLCCVGDDDQSIYRFQGASVGNFKMLRERLTDITTISLTENYRSSKELIEISARAIGLIPPAERALVKALNSARRSSGTRDISFIEFTREEEELLYVVEKVREVVSMIKRDDNASCDEKNDPFSSIAVLVRKRANILKVIDAFLQAGIPYATDGKEDISGEFRVKQLLDALELASVDINDRPAVDLALYKVLSADYFGIPQADILKFMRMVDARKRAENAPGISMLEDFLHRFASEKCDTSFPGWERFRRAQIAIAHLLDNARQRPVHSILLNYIKDAGIFSHILSEYRDKGILRIRQVRGVSSFVNMVKTSDIAHPAIGLDDLMAEIKTRKDHGMPVQGDLVTLTQTGVRIYTAHGSKGMEFHTVIIPFCLHNRNWPARPIPEKIQLPSDLFKTKEAVAGKEDIRRLAAQDETRLFYVAMTRAKTNLIFTASPAEDSVPSRYLESLGLRAQGGPFPEDKVIEKSLEVSDAEDPFIGTQGILRNMTESLSLNPTRLNTYLVCPRRFLYNDVLKIPGSKKKSLVFGNCVHKALEDTYRAYMHNKKFPTFQFFSDAFRTELNFQGVEKAMARDCLTKLETIKDWFGRARKDAVMPLGLEEKLLITVGDNIIFTGKYDKIEWENEKDGLIRIVDYKTGKPDNHLKDIDKDRDIFSADCDGYFRQLVCYKLLFERSKNRPKGKSAGSGALEFIEPVSVDLKREGYKKGDYVRKTVQLTDEMVSRLEELIKDVWARIRRLEFGRLKERDDKICSRCDFEALCWERQP